MSLVSDRETLDEAERPPNLISATIRLLRRLRGELFVIIYSRIRG